MAGNMKKFLIGLGIVGAITAALAVVAWFKFCPKLGSDEALTFPVDSEYTKWIGKPADLDFVGLDGRKVTSGKLRGKVVLLDFWATWCPSCMQSRDQLKSTYAKFNGQGLEVVGINFDEDRAAVEAAVKSKGLPWPQYFEGRENSLGRKFGISHYPSVWLLDRAGNVRYISALADTEKKISALLAESETQAVKVGQNANSGYLGRINAGLTTIRTLKASGLLSSVTARAKSIDDASADANIARTGPAPANVAGLSEALKLRSVILSAAPSAVIKTGDASCYLGIGETMRVHTTQGNVELRCESIQKSGVTMRDVQSGMKVELRLN
jgi:thiol-disulfide isomerase/thioredoxin